MGNHWTSVRESSSKQEKFLKCCYSDSLKDVLRFAGFHTQLLLCSKSLLCNFQLVCNQGNHLWLQILQWIYICYSWISNLWPVFKPFNRIISWLAGFKTGPVYAKSKSGSISRRARSKSGPVHALDGLPPRVRGQRSFRCIKATGKRSCKTIWERG